MKKFGVTHLLLVSPVGSLAEKIHPGRTLFVPDQFIDCTRHRQYTLFPEIAVHVAMDDPVCSTLTANLVDACLKVNDSNVFHPGTVLIMEGPSSPMRAQSRRHLKRGAHAVGMTAIPTAMLAREAQMCFATLCLPETQNHCMTKKKTEARDNLALYGDKPIRVIRKLCRTLRGPNHTDCRCQHALEHAVLTNMHGWTIPPASKDVFRMFGIPLPKLPVR